MVFQRANVDNSDAPGEGHGFLKLQIYIFKQLVVSLLFAVGGILFVALPGIAVSTVHRMPLADAQVLLRYVPMVLEGLAPYALPVCFILAVVATYGRLAADREWTAIQMAGFQPLKMLLPGVVVALALGGATYWMVSYELPLAKQRQRSLLLEAATSSIKNLQPGRTTLDLGKFKLVAQRRDKVDPNILYMVHIRKPAEEDEETTVDVYADKVHIRVKDEWLLVDLYNSRTYAPGEAVKPEMEHLFLRKPMSELVGQKKANFNRARYMTNPEIEAELAEGIDEKDRRISMEFELHYRRSMGAIFLVFLGVGAPTGLILRRGTQLGALAVAVGYGLLYYIFAVRLGREIGRSGSVEPWIGAWAVPVVGGLIALFMIHRAMKR